MSADQAGDDPVIRPFADALLELSGGRTHAELGEKLHDLIAAVRDTGKKGSITLTITVARMKKSDRILEVSDNVTAKIPSLDREVAVFYTDANGNLSRTDPDQLSFESLREVPPPAVEVREAK